MDQLVLGFALGVMVVVVGLWADILLRGRREDNMGLDELLAREERRRKERKTRESADKFFNRK
jgi:hypothetical protein